jgi:hypothetical protein
MEDNGLLNLAGSQVAFSDGTLDISTLSKQDVIARRHSLEDAAQQWSNNPDGNTIYGVDVDPQGFVYAVTVGTDGKTLYKYDRNGSEIWSTTFSNDLRSVEATGTGEVYVAGLDNLYKVFANGTVKWTQSNVFDQSSREVRAHPAGAVYTVGDDGYLRKFDETGTQQWEFNVSADPAQGLGIDPLGYAYVGTDTNKLLAFDRDGTSLWNKSDYSEAVTDVASDGTYVYTGTWNAGTIKKRFASNGTAVWSTGAAHSIRTIDVDNAGRVYVGYSGSSQEVTALSADGSQELWQFGDFSAPVRTLKVDREGYIYAGSGDNTVRKLSGASYINLYSYDGTRLVPLN